MKDKIDDWKTKNVAKQIAQLRKDNAKLEQQLADLQAGRPTKTIKIIRQDSVTNTGDDHLKKHIYEQPPDELDQGENSQNEMRKEETHTKTKINPTKEEPCKNQTQQMRHMSKRPMKRSRKRCHFCRKRGHKEIV